MKTTEERMKLLNNININKKGEKIMIRPEVEKLRGYTFTMEEMCDIIIPIIETSLCMLRLNGHVHEENTLPVYIEKPAYLRIIRK